MGEGAPLSTTFRERSNCSDLLCLDRLYQYDCRNIAARGAAVPSLAQIASVFARYANLTLGGGSATTATIHHEIVYKRHWVSQDKFSQSFA
jgi:hypothetical protein